MNSVGAQVEGTNSANVDVADLRISKDASPAECIQELKSAIDRALQQAKFGHWSVRQAHSYLSRMADAMIQLLGGSASPVGRYTYDQGGKQIRAFTQESRIEQAIDMLVEHEDSFMVYDVPGQGPYNIGQQGRAPNMPPLLQDQYGFITVYAVREAPGVLDANISPDPAYPYWIPFDSIVF
jgi:hypothetical protein